MIYYAQKHRPTSFNLITQMNTHNRDSSTDYYLLLLNGVNGHFIHHFGTSYYLFSSLLLVHGAYCKERWMSFVRIKLFINERLRS